MGVVVFLINTGTCLRAMCGVQDYDDEIVKSKDCSMRYNELSATVVTDMV